MFALSRYLIRLRATGESGRAKGRDLTRKHFPSERLLKENFLEEFICQVSKEGWDIKAPVRTLLWSTKPLNLNKIFSKNLMFPFSYQ